MSALKSADRRAIRMGLLVAVPVLVGRCALQPYLGALGETRSRLAAERSLLARETALVDARDAMQKVADKTAVAFSVRSRRLFEGNRTLAGAELVGYVADVASANRMLVEAVAPRGEEELGAGHVTRILVDVRVVGDIEGVLGFLRDLHRGHRLVRIERLTLERQEAAGTAGPDDLRLISVGATVAAYMLVPDSSTEKDAR